MSIQAFPGQTITTPPLTGAPQGLEGTITVAIVNQAASPAAVLVAATAAGVVEYPQPDNTSNYEAQIAIPLSALHTGVGVAYQIVWMNGATFAGADDLEIGVAVGVNLAPLLTRLKERAETDLTDSELTAILSDAAQDIEDRYGPYADPANPITVTLEGRVRKLDLARPAATITSITEHLVADAFDVLSVETDDLWFTSVGDVPTVLAADDYRIWNGGRTLERLFTGTHPRVFWGARADISYVPVDDSARRDEVAIKLALLAIEYEGVIDRQVGDVRTTHGPRSPQPGQSILGYQEERQHLLASLQPRRGLFLR